MAKPPDKTVVITGASRGIGAATARRFLQAGWRALGTSTTGTGEVEHERLTMLKLDLSDESSIAAFVETVQRQHIKPDVLINNAAINPGPDGEALVIDTLRQTLAVDLIGLISLTEQLLPALPPDGRIINLTSSASDINNKYIQVISTPYGIAKAGVNLYTHNLARRVASQGLTVVALHPGWVRTDMGSPAAPKTADQAAEELYELATQRNIKTDTLWDNKHVIAWW